MGSEQRTPEKVPLKKFPLSLGQVCLNSKFYRLVFEPREQEFVSNF